MNASAASPTDVQPTVLYVHDDDDEEHVTRILASGGHRVIEARSGDQALEVAAETRLDIIVLDLAADGGSIAELIRRLRAHHSSRTAGILNITDREEPTGSSTHEAGSDAYLPKPVDSRGLLAQIDALLRVQRAEQQARRFAKQWRTAFDAITDAILILTRDGRVTHCNRAALRVLRCPREQVIGRSYLELLDIGAPAPVDLASLNYRDNPLTTEIAIGSRWYRLAVDPIQEDSVLDGGDVVVVLTDLTELKRYDEDLVQHARELEVQNRRQTEFLRLLSHELRNPLAAIAAAATTLTQTAESEPVAPVAPLKVIQRQVRNLTHMVADLLDVSRIAAGKIVLQTRRYDVREAVQAALDAAQPAVEQLEHTLRVRMSEQPLHAQVDPTRLEQMLANLLDNAIKYTDRGGQIDVELGPDPQEPEQFLRIRVRDNGGGLNAEALHDAFEMFVQYDRTLARAQGGLGLGLSLVKTLAELHGGSVAAHSDGPGCGTTMVVRLPRWQQTEMQAMTDSPTTAEPESTGPKPRSILLVEDNEDLRQLVAFRLQRAGHDVRQAASGPEGKRMALSDPPDVLVLDIGLPDMDGYQLARELRQNETLSNCLMIALTGYGSAEARAATSAAGFDTHLVKPVDLNELKSLIERGRPATAKSTPKDRTP